MFLTMPKGLGAWLHHRNFKLAVRPQSRAPSALP
jgi:hypothetical protein